MYGKNKGTLVDSKVRSSLLPGSRVCRFFRRVMYLERATSTMTVHPKTCHAKPCALPYCTHCQYRSTRKMCTGRRRAVQSHVMRCQPLTMLQTGICFWAGHSCTYKAPVCCHAVILEPKEKMYLYHQTVSHNTSMQTTKCMYSLSI